MSRSLHVQELSKSVCRVTTARRNQLARTTLCVETGANSCSANTDSKGWCHACASALCIELFACALMLQQDRGDASLGQLVCASILTWDRWAVIPPRCHGRHRSSDDVACCTDTKEGRRIDLIAFRSTMTEGQAWVHKNYHDWGRHLYNNWRSCLISCLTSRTWLAVKW